MFRNKLKKYLRHEFRCLQSGSESSFFTNYNVFGQRLKSNWLKTTNYKNALSTYTGGLKSIVFSKIMYNMNARLFWTIPKIAKVNFSIFNYVLYSYKRPNSFPLTIFLLLCLSIYLSFFSYHYVWLVLCRNLVKKTNKRAKKNHKFNTIK